MESQIEQCEICGCKEFTTDAGFYYCLECGTRAKEVQEVQYELTQGFSTVRLHTRKIKKAASAKSTENKLTSWEIYNYILVGLVNELQKLGASETFKITTLQLWTAYLSNIEVAFTSKKETLIPKLPVTFKQLDAEILYGRMRSRRKRKMKNLNSSMRLDTTLDQTSLDATLVSKQRRVEKRALIEAEYEAITGTQQSDTNSLFNSSFQTAKTSSTATSSKYIKYSTEARKECLQYMDRKHFNRHTKDENCMMKCHKRKPSEKYLKSATFVTRNCLWSILYLALNISEDSIQLGDMIRYCREGTLSYYSLKHFIPEDYIAEDKNNEVLENAKYKVPNHDQILIVAAKIANIIKIRNIKRPNFFMLSSRYCTELELPPFIAECVQKLSSSNVNEVGDIITKKKAIPNYEGRVMAYILFILKLIFGLDDCTEYDISSKVKILNIELPKIDNNHVPIFSWSDWLYFIEFRKLIISQKHFPTKLLLDPKCDKSGHNFANFWKKIKLYDDTDNTNMPQLFSIMKKVFTDLIRLQDRKKPDLIIFEPSLTPFKTYFQTIIESCDEYKVPDQLKNNHCGCDISFYINGSENKINLIDKELIVKFKNESSNKVIHIIDIDAELKNEKDISAYKVNRHELVKIQSIGTLEWIIKKEEAESSQSYKDEIKEAKRKTLVLKQQLNEVKALKLQAKDEIHKLQLAKFGGPVDIRTLREQMVERTKYPTLNNSNKSNKYANTISKPLLPSPRRNLRGRFLGGPSDEIITKCKNQHRKWFMSSYCANPLLEKHDLRLDQQILAELTSKTKAKEIVLRDTINIPRPAAQYWINHFSKNQVTNTFYEKIETKFPSSFLCLLEECARTVEMSKFDLYKELVEIEKQFGLIQFLDRNREHIGMNVQ